VVRAGEDKLLDYSYYGMAAVVDRVDVVGPWKD
jgi:hypothetical protein